MKVTAEMLKSEVYRKFKGDVRRWWQSLEDDRGQRAELRRCRTPTQVYVAPAYRDHFARILTETPFWLDGNEQEQAQEAKDMEWMLERLALPIGVLARARVLEHETHFAALFAQRGKGSPAMRDVRFRQLLAIPDGGFDALFTMLLRLVRLMDNVASLPGLLECGLFWNDTTRIRWAKEYYPNRVE